MNWRALRQDQWFQLCLLVALLSGGTMIYNATTKTTAGSPSSLTQSSRPTPAPPKMKSKTRGQWILDATGARDSDGSDWAAVAANLTDGDVVTFRPGTYTGNCEINSSVRLLGPTSDKGKAIIRGTDPKQVGLRITGRKVSFENLTIDFATAGEGPSIRIAGDASVEMINCVTTTQSKFDVYLTEKGSLHAENSSFQGTGSCIRSDGNAQTTLAHCTVSDGKWGIESFGGARVECKDCTFQKLGAPTVKGLVANAVGASASAKFESCTFTENTAPILADQGATLTIIGSVFRNNGVDDAPENVTTGLICAQGEAKGTLKDDEFYDNKQGIVVFQKGSLTLENVRMQRTGLKTQNAKISRYSHAVIAHDDGNLSLTGCTIAESVQNGLFVGSGSHLKITNSTISDSGFSNLVLGFPNARPAEAELDHVQLLAAISMGAMVTNGSHLTLQHGRVSDAKRAGILAREANSQVEITDTTISGCAWGLTTDLGAAITANGCTIEHNGRGAQAGTGKTGTDGGTISLTACKVQSNTEFGVGAYREARLTMKGGYLGDNHQDTLKQGDVTIEP